MINHTVTKIVTTLDLYCLANMASQGIYKDRNANACLKTSLRHIVHELFNYQRSKEDLKYQENHKRPAQTQEETEIYHHSFRLIQLRFAWFLSVDEYSKVHDMESGVLGFHSCVWIEEGYS